jgi:VanZ family protein
MNAVPRHATVGGSQRAYAIVLVLATIFIVYGSLFPFEYRERYYPSGPVVYLLSTWHDWDHRGDLLSNILLYIPFGFFLTYALPPRLSGNTRAILATAAGTLMAACIEVIQFHDLGRVTSMGDVYANGIGSAVGAAAAAAIGAAMRWPFMRELGAHPAASLLLVMFFGYRLYPYVPTIDLHKYWHTIRPLLHSPSLPLDSLLRFTVIWLFIAVIIHSLYGFGRFLLLFPLVAGFEYVGRIFVIGGILELPDVVGGIAAYVLWAGVHRDLGVWWHDRRIAVAAIPLHGHSAAVRLDSIRQFHARLDRRRDAGVL